MIPERFRTPFGFLILASVAMPLGFAAWTALLNNFAIEMAGFTGKEMGYLQSLREVPGFLAFTAVFVILVLREQTFAVVSVAMFGIGVAMTGFLPSEYGLYFTALVMSIGFHYFETIRQSLSLQWLTKEEAPRKLGRLIAIGSMTSLIGFASIYVLLEVFRSTTTGFTSVPAGRRSSSPLRSRNTPRSNRRPRSARPSSCANATSSITA